MRGRGRTMALVALACLAVGPGAGDAAAPPPALLAGAPVAGSTPKVTWVGDSITALNFGTLEASLQRHQVPSWRIAAQTGRRMAASFAYPSSTIYSGLQAISAAKAAGADPDLWVVALGTNDVRTVGGCGCNVGTELRRRIDAVRAAIGPGHHVLWVNVRVAQNPVTTALFNEALAAAAAADPHLEIIDWYTLSAGHSSWLLDGVHPTSEGAAALFGLGGLEVARRLPQTVVPPPSTVEAPAPPPVTVAPSAGSPTAALPAVRLQTPVPPVGGSTVADRCGSLDAAGFRSISPSSTGPRVAILQCALREHGFEPGSTSGSFDAATKTAVLRFQIFQGLYGSGSGVVGGSTAGALGILRFD